MNFPFQYVFLVFVCSTSIRAQTSHGTCCDDSECLRREIQSYLDQLAGGVRRGDQVVTDNPYMHNEALIYNINVPQIRYQGFATNNVFEGLADSRVSEARVSYDGPNTVFSFTTVTPHLHHNANYMFVDVVINGSNGDETPPNESGSVTFSYRNATFDHDITLGRVNFNGMDVLRVLNYNVRLQHADEYATNFSNHDAVTTLVDDNLLEIVRQIRPDIDNAYSMVFGRLFQIFFSGVPADSLCPARE